MGDNDLGKTSLGMNANIAALLSYTLGFVTGIIFYLLENENKYVRFHAMQSTVVFIFFSVLQIFLTFIPIIGWALIPFVSLSSLILWIVLMVKAYKGEKFMLPYAGEFADKKA